MNTLLFVNATIVFSENLILAKSVLVNSLVNDSAFKQIQHPQQPFSYNSFDKNDKQQTYRLSSFSMSL